MRNKITISSEIYVRNYGHNPKSRGSWAFCLQSDYDKPNYSDLCIWSPSLPYGEAKAWFKKEAKIRGLSGTYVVCT